MVLKIHHIQERVNDFINLFNSRVLVLFAKKVLKPPFYDGGIFVVLKEFTNDLAYKTVSEIDFAIKFNTALNLYPVNDVKKIEILKRRFNYLKRLCQELVKRAP